MSTENNYVVFSLLSKNLTRQRWVLIDQVAAGQKLIAEKKKLLLTSTFPENLPDVLADKTEITRVISNLLDNAIKYTETGEIKLSAVRKGNEIEVAIKDTGIGIDLARSINI